MDEHNVISRIKERFASEGDQALIPLIRGNRRGNRLFKAELSKDGIYVDNLGVQPFLPLAVFIETVELLHKMGGRALKGNAMNYKLGSKGLPFDSAEGHIAHSIYGKKAGESVFRRITPIAYILIWAGICCNDSGYLVLLDLS